MRAAWLGAHHPAAGAMRSPPRPQEPRKHGQDVGETEKEPQPGELPKPPLGETVRTD